MRRVILACSLMLMPPGCSRPAPAPAPESSAADDGSPDTRRSAPADALDDIVQLEAASEQTCALRADGQVYCWGRLAGLEQVQARPRRVAGIEAAREIVVHHAHSFAVERSGEVVTWGGLTGPHYRHRRFKDPRGSLRVGGSVVEGWSVEPTEPLDPALSAEAAAAAHPHEVRLDPSDWLPPQWRVTARAVSTRLHTDGTIFVANSMLCTHGRGGGLSCVRPNFFDAFPSWNESQTGYEPNLVDMATSAVPEVCLLRRDGSIECVRYPNGKVETWGDQHFRIDRVPLPGPAAAIASGSCGAVLLRDGHVVTWCETNEEGYLDTKTKTNPDIDDAVAIAMDGSLICVLRRNDAVTCWWEDRDAHFYMPTPRTITTLDHPTQIAVGDRHVCALVADGHVQCWGGNERGQLGNGSIDGNLGEDEFPPMLIPDTPPTWVVAPEPPPP